MDQTSFLCQEYLLDSPIFSRKEQSRAYSSNRCPAMEVNPKKRKYFTLQLTAEFLKTPRIPPDFASDWKGKSSGFCRLKAADYQKSVRVCMLRKRGHYYLTHGWRNLVKRLQLVEGSFVSFFLIPPRTFEVLPFPDLTHHETSAAHTLEDSAPADGSAERRSSLRGPRCRKILVQEQGEEDGSGKIISFKSCLKPSHMTLMILPKAFATDTGIIDQENVVLNDEDGKDWPLKVTLTKEGANVRRVDLTKGWTSFRTANNYSVGQMLEFKFHESTGKIHVNGPTLAASSQSEDREPDHCPKSCSSLRGPHVREILEQEGSGDDIAIRVCLKQYHMYFMDLPEAFAREAGIMDQESVVLTDEDGEDWTVKVATRSRLGSGYRVELWWKSFRRANKFVVGEILEFKFHNSTAKIHVKKIRE